MRWTGLLLLTALPTLAGCEAGGEAPGSEPAEPAQQEAGNAAVASTGDAGPTLLAVMRQLEVDMQRVSRALWAGRADSVAAAARAVADHPQVGPAERARIMGILGPRGAAFAAADRHVHDAAVELARTAAEGDPARTVRVLGPLQEGCVACHEEFRDQLRTTRSGP